LKNGIIDLSSRERIDKIPVLRDIWLPFMDDFRTEFSYVLGGYDWHLGRDARRAIRPVWIVGKLDIVRAKGTD
jgi:hypothetical protein